MRIIRMNLDAQVQTYAQIERNLRIAMRKAQKLRKRRVNRAHAVLPRILPKREA